MKIYLNRYTMVAYKNGIKLYAIALPNSNHDCVFDAHLYKLLADGYKVVKVNNRKKFAVLEKDA